MPVDAHNRCTRLVGAPLAVAVRFCWCQTYLVNTRVVPPVGHPQSRCSACIPQAESLVPLTEPHDRSATNNTTKYAHMASQRSVQQMLALDDNALIQFMTRNRDEQGMFDVSSIIDWSYIAGPDQSKLLQRLA